MNLQTLNKLAIGSLAAAAMLAGAESAFAVTFPGNSDFAAFGPEPIPLVDLPVSLDDADPVPPPPPGFLPGVFSHATVGLDGVFSAMITVSNDIDNPELTLQALATTGAFIDVTKEGDPEPFLSIPFPDQFIPINMQIAPGATEVVEVDIDGFAEAVWNKDNPDDLPWLEVFSDGFGGDDVVNFTVDADGFFGATGQAGLDITTSAQASGTLSVEYDYHFEPEPQVDIPEPTSILGLLAFGGLGLGLKRKKQG